MTMSNARLAATLASALAFALAIGFIAHGLPRTTFAPACMVGGIETLTTNCRTAP